jgi:hypothetical protein
MQMGRHASSTSKVGCRSDRPTDKEIERQIRSKIGKPVKFKYPDDEGERRGVLKDRVVIKGAVGFKKIPYWDVVDLIEFQGAQSALWMRVGYYRYTKGRLVWGSQTTLTEPLGIWRTLFAAARSRSWFAELLRK